MDACQHNPRNLPILQQLLLLLLVPLLLLLLLLLLLSRLPLLLLMPAPQRVWGIGLWRVGRPPFD